MWTETILTDGGDFGKSGAPDAVCKIIGCNG
jgi:hypothetical protein